jgi:predicted nuclease of predicted toxin-antitoxin system
MKLLLDTCVSPRTRDELLAAGHEVAWAGDWPADPGDEEILEAARRDSCILITLDKDFGELAIAFAQKHAGIVRLVDIPVRKQASVCMRALGQYGNNLLKGALVTVEPGRVRVRPHVPDPLDTAEI